MSYLFRPSYTKHLHRYLFEPKSLFVEITFLIINYTFCLTLSRNSPLFQACSSMSCRNVLCHRSLNRSGDFLPSALNQRSRRLYIFMFIHTTSDDTGVTYFLVHVVTACGFSTTGLSQILTLREFRVHLSCNDSQWCVRYRMIALIGVNRSESKKFSPLK